MVSFSISLLSAEASGATSIAATTVGRFPEFVGLSWSIEGVSGGSPSGGYCASIEVVRLRKLKR